MYWNIICQNKTEMDLTNQSVLTVCELWFLWGKTTQKCFFSLVCITSVVALWFFVVIVRISYPQRERNLQHEVLDVSLTCFCRPKLSLERASCFFGSNMGVTRGAQLVDNYSLLTSPLTNQNIFYNHYQKNLCLSFYNKENIQLYNRMKSV